MLSRALAASLACAAAMVALACSSGGGDESATPVSSPTTTASAVAPAGPSEVPGGTAVAEDALGFRFVLPSGYRAAARGAEFPDGRTDRYYSNEDAGHPGDLTTEGVFLTVRTAENPDEISVSEWVQSKRGREINLCDVSASRELSVAGRPAVQITVVPNCEIGNAVLTYVGAGQYVYIVWMTPGSAQAAEDERPAYDSILSTFEILPAPN